MNLIKKAFVLALVVALTGGCADDDKKKKGSGAGGGGGGGGAGSGANGGAGGGAGDSLFKIDPTNAGVNVNNVSGVWEEEPYDDEFPPVVITDELVQQQTEIAEKMNNNIPCGTDAKDDCDEDGQYKVILWQENYVKGKRHTRIKVTNSDITFSQKCVAVDGTEIVAQVKIQIQLNPSAKTITLKKNNTSFDNQFNGKFACQIDLRMDEDSTSNYLLEDGMFIIPADEQEQSRFSKISN